MEAAARRITLLTTGLDYGGAERQVYLIARGLRARGWDVDVVSMLPPRAFVEDLQGAGIPVLALDMRRRVPSLGALVRLARHLRRRKPRVLHCHMVHANLMGRVARLLAPVPVLISTAHSVFEGPRWREWAYRFTDRLGDLTTNVTRAGVERYIAVGAAPPHRIAWVPNGIDLDAAAPNPAGGAAPRRRENVQGRFLWLAVGNLREPKDYPNLFAAFARLADHPAGPLLWIAGAGELHRPLEELAVRLGIGDRVRLLGLRLDIPDLLAAADAYVMSSSWEGLPLALLEAAAAGLPVVSTAVGGVPEAVPEGGGILVPPGDADALAAAMRAVMGMHAEERAAMGARGREAVRSRFGLGEVLDRWEEVYAAVAAALKPLDNIRYNT